MLRHFTIYRGTCGNHIRHYRVTIYSTIQTLSMRILLARAYNLWCLVFYLSVNSMISAILLGYIFNRVLIYILWLESQYHLLYLIVSHKQEGVGDPCAKVIYVKNYFNGTLNIGFSKLDRGEGSVPAHRLPPFIYSNVSKNNLKCSSI